MRRKRLVCILLAAATVLSAMLSFGGCADGGEGR